MIHTILKSHYAIKAFSAALALVGLLALAGQSQAAVVITYNTAGAGVYEPYNSVVSATDAVNQGSAVLLYYDNVSGQFGSSSSKLNDGVVFDGIGDRGDTGKSFTPGDGTVILFTFKAPQNVLSINTFAMSGPGQLRSAQDYKLEYRQSSLSAFTTLFSNLNTANPNLIDAGNTSTWVNLDFTTFPGGSLANVDALRFTFHDVGGDATLYREIDVNVVPEPSSASLLVAGIGALIILRYRRLRA